MAKYEIIKEVKSELLIDKSAEYLIGYYDKEIKKLMDEKNRLYEKIQSEMEKKNIKKIDTGRIKITYVDSTTYESFDKATFKKENKEIYNKYTSIEPKEAYIIVKVNHDDYEDNQESQD